MRPELANLAPEQIAALRRGDWIGPDPLGRAPGTPLWPQRWDAQRLQQIRAVAKTYNWTSMYQQHPQKLEGNLIPAYQIVRITPRQLPDVAQWVRYWDLAVSGNKDADWLAGAKVGLHEHAFYIRHIAHFPGPWSTARGRMTAVMLRDGLAVPQGIEVSGQQGGYYQELKRDPVLTGNVVLERVNPRDVGDKVVRASAWGSLVQDRLIFVVDDGTWDVDGFIDEAAAFPNGAHDDRVDGVSGGVQMLSSGSGWSAWAAAQQLQNSVAGTAPLSEIIDLDARFEQRVREVAERGGGLIALPLGLNLRVAGNLMADIAALYLNQGQVIKARIVLEERRRLGV